MVGTRAACSFNQRSQKMVVQGHARGQARPVAPPTTRRTSGRDLLPWVSETVLIYLQGTPRNQRLRTNKYDKNITKRGSILDPTIEVGVRSPFRRGCSPIDANRPPGMMASSNLPRFL